MAAGKGKKKNVTGTLPKNRTDSPLPGPKKKGGAGPRKTPRGTTRRSGEK